MKFWSLSIPAALLTLFTIGCTPSSGVIPDRGVDYFPISIGDYRVYQVDSVIFDDAGNTNSLDTFSALIRERVMTATVNEKGDSTFQIERAFRRDSLDPWQVTDIWTTSRIYPEAMRVEENQRLVKMEFPLYPGKRWDPVRYLDPGIEVHVGTEDIEMFIYWSGEVIGIDQPEEVHGTQFPDVMTCYQADEDTDIERRYVMEKYAKHIGLIARVDTILDSRCKRIGDFAPCEGMPWIEKGEKGYIMQMTLIDHN